MTSITAYHYIKIVEVLGGFCDVHRSLPVRQDLQLLLGRPRDAHRGLPLHQDLQFVRGLVTPTAAYHYIKLYNSWEFSRRALQLNNTSGTQLLGGLVMPSAAYRYIKIFNSWEAL